MSWVDKMKAGMERAAGQAEDMASIGKLRLEIHTLTGKMQDALRAIGARAYDLYGSGSTALPAEIVALCREADTVAADIKAKEAEIEKIKAEA